PGPDLLGNPPDELELPLEEAWPAVGAMADGVVGRLDHQPVGMGVELEGHLPDVFEHKSLGLGPRRAEIIAPAADARLADRPTVPADGPGLRVLQRVPVHAVVAEGREAEQDLDAPRVGMVDQVAHEVLADVLVLLVVLPGDGELPGSERPGDP